MKLDIESLWCKIQDRYQYDCGDKTMPLNPVILSAKLTFEEDPKDVSYLISKSILADYIKKNCIGKKPEKVKESLQAGSWGNQGIGKE